jgi:Zn-dependent peptidase ImmA (M78 family)
MKKINVKGQVYSIKYYSRKKMDAIRGDAAGLCDIITKTIYICTDQTEQEQVKTLYHEIFHALMEETGCRQIINYSTEQVAAEAFSNFIFKHFIERDNGRQRSKKTNETTKRLRISKNKKQSR